jgi:hypothetical protein
MLDLAYRRQAARAHTPGVTTGQEGTAVCSACGQELQPVFEGVSPRDYQYDNAMWIGLFGGYGMFVDNLDAQPGVVPGPPDIALVVCHDCAHALCDANPWLAKAIQPANSHAHSYDRDWTGHTGWDLPRKSRS